MHGGVRDNVFQKSIINHDVNISKVLHYESENSLTITQLYGNVKRPNKNEYLTNLNRKKYGNSKTTKILMKNQNTLTTLKLYSEDKLKTSLE